MASNSPSSSPSSSTDAQASPSSSTSRQNAAQHRPSVPSSLRQTQMPPSSPEARYHRQQEYHSEDTEHPPELESSGVHPYAQDFAQVQSGLSETRAVGELDEPSESPTARTRLLSNEHKYNVLNDCGEYDCNHGTFSQPRRQRGYGSIASNYDGPAISVEERSQDAYGGHLPQELADNESLTFRGYYIEGALGSAVTDGLLGKSNTRTTTAWLVRKYGVANEQWLYVRIRNALSSLVLCVLTFVLAVGIFSTTSHSRTGSDNTAGLSCTAISSLL